MKYKIGDFLKRVRVPVSIEDNVDYQLVTIKVNHRGIVPRSTKKGIEIGSKTMYKVSEGQFILSGIDARHGAFGIIPKELEGGVVTNDFWYFDYDEKIISKEYFLYLTSTPLFADVCRIASEGTTNRVRLQAKKFFDYEVWLPKVSEQHAVVEGVSSKEIEHKKLQTELKTQSNLLSKLRQAYLQEAVMGKLTEPSQDNAQTLLKAIKSQKAELIKQGKLRKEKPLAPIKPEEIPFEIPDNWVWCRLGEAIVLGSGQDLQPHEYSDSDSEGLPYLTGASNFENERVLVNRWTKTPKSIAVKGDLLITCKGSGIGKMAWLNEDKVHIARQIMSVRSSFIDTKYVKFILQLNTVKYRANAKSLIPGIDRDTILLTLIPLPPLSEQKAIVAKVERLLGNISLLESENKAQQIEVQRLMGAVLQEAFGGR